MLLVLNGLLAKFGLWQARRHGTAEQLQRLATEQAAAGTARLSLAQQTATDGPFASGRVRTTGGSSALRPNG